MIARNSAGARVLKPKPNKPMKNRITNALLALVISLAPFTARAAEVKPPDTNLLFVVSSRLALTTIESEPEHRWDYFRKSVEQLIAAKIARNEILELERCLTNVFAAIGHGPKFRPNTIAFFEGQDLDEVRSFLATAEEAVKLKAKFAKK